MYDRSNKISLKYFKDNKETLSKLNIEDRFKYIYQNNLWGNKESVSGTGSTLEQTKELRNQLSYFIEQYRISSIVDAPCGDFNWMKHVIDTDDITYFGVDIVPEIVESNQSKYGGKNINFLLGDITETKLPDAKLLICRDCFVHLRYLNIFKALHNFKRSNIRYLLTTNFMNTTENYDIEDGDWRPLNFTKAPFYFPKPDYIINEQCTEFHGKYSDKSLCLWYISNAWI